MACTSNSSNMSCVHMVGLLALIAVSDPAAADGTLYTDPFGTTTGTLDLDKKGQEVDTFTYPYSSVAGPLGTATGKIGSDKVETFQDPAGMTTGKVGKMKVKIFTGPFGVTTGTVGKNALDCFSDEFGNTDC